MKNFLLYIVVALTLLLMSCKTVEVVNTETVIVPEIVFPVFPDLENVTINENGTITVAKDWVMQLAEYKIRMQQAVETYNNVKALYDDTRGDKSKMNEL